MFGPAFVLLASLGVTLAACGGSEPEAPDDDAFLGAPLVVNGEVISRDEIKRHAAFMGSGRGLYELAKIQVHIDQEIQRQIEQEGKTAEDFEISQAELDAAVARARRTVEEQFRGQPQVSLKDFYPTEDPSWLDQVKQTKLFTRVFLPENPREYPPATVAAMMDEEGGPGILEVLEQDWDRKQEAEPGTEPADDADPGARIFEMMLRGRVLDYLRRTEDERKLEDGIPVHLLGIVNGVEIPVDLIWGQVKDELSPADVWMTRRWLVAQTVLRQALEQSGFLISVEEAEAIWDEETGPFTGTMFSYENLAVNFKRFPTVGSYQTYRRFYESYRRKIAEEITDEALERHGRDRTAAIVSLSTVDADIMLLSAYDFRGKRWLENGWENAAARAREVSRRLAAGEDWDTLLVEYSDFYDPPLPDAALKKPEVLRDQFHQGRFRGWHHNELAKKLGDSEFRLFLSGESVTDIIFFGQDVGTIENPLRGPYGYYIPRLLHRAAPARSLRADDRKDRSFLEQDYLDARLREYTQELIAAADVPGM